MEHTREQLKIVDSLIYRLDKPEEDGGSNVCEINVSMWNGSRDSEQRAEGARRVLACVNACAGIDTDVLDVTHGLDEIYNDLLRQRDELLAALNVIANGEAMKVAPFAHADTVLKYQEIARASIAKAEAAQ